MIPSTSTPTKVGRGRKLMRFEDVSPNFKNRKTVNLRSMHTKAELSYALQMKLRESGQSDVASVVQNVTQDSSQESDKVSSACSPASYTALEALALILDLNLTRKSDERLRKGAKKRNIDFYPSYREVMEAKTSCYPEPTSIEVSERCAEVRLADLLKHTTSRIIEANADSLDNFTDDELRDVVMTVKWGFDGTNGLKEFNMKFKGDDGTFSDQNVFVTHGKILFQNKRPSSVRYCRPVRIQYTNETLILSR
jgi:hypothetical protein